MATEMYDTHAFLLNNGTYVIQIPVFSGILVFI